MEDLPNLFALQRWEHVNFMKFENVIFYFAIRSKAKRLVISNATTN